MEKNTCKLCFRSFANGRALGGHMRTHVAAAKATAKIHKNSSSSSSSTSSRDDEDGPAIGYGLRENPKRSFRLVDPEFSPAVDAGSSAIVHDRESESGTESSAHRRRSKRSRPIPAEPEPDSSVSDTATEEDVAISLMMLSRDTWNNNDDFDDNDEKHRTVKGRSKYQCGTCKKVFRSYQALGGHRASHKKFKSCVPPPKQSESSAEADADARADHVCPVCSRSFATGQALGGHKRSHFASSAVAAAVSRAPAAPNASKFSIDLNLPAPTEEEEEDTDQMSAVFDELN